MYTCRKRINFQIVFKVFIKIRYCTNVLKDLSVKRNFTLHFAKMKSVNQKFSLPKAPRRGNLRCYVYSDFTLETGDNPTLRTEGEARIK